VACRLRLVAKGGLGHTPTTRADATHYGTLGSTDDCDAESPEVIACVAAD